MVRRELPPLRTLGRRLPDQSFARSRRMSPGDYGRDPETGIWWVKPPRGTAFPLEDHRVIEHEGGTISVEPAITAEPVGTAQTPWSSGWQGHLVHGIWEEF